MSRYQTASNIRVSVALDSVTVFAGEDVACTITFTNTARTSEQGANTATSPGRTTQYRRKVTPIQPQGRPAGSRQSSHGYGSSIPAHMRKGQGRKAVGSLDVGGQGGGARPRHGRSLSILSMGTDVGTVVSMPRERGGKGHERTISVQTAPRRGSVSKQESAQSSGSGSPRVGAPIITEQDVDGQATVRPKRPGNRRPLSEAKKSPGILHQDFRFPAAPAPEDASSPVDLDSAVSPKAESLPFRTLSPPLSDSNANPIARVLSQSSVNDSPRSSLDLFSEAMSNHSDETLVSEYIPQQMARLLPRPNHVRNNSRLGVREAPRGPETIIMGYAQIMGSFTLEGSLVNQAPFEEIKRKGVVGSHGGGGVVGVERTKRDSGLFGAFGWGNIGESIGGLLGGGELSSIKEMGRIANSKSIPLITTPPSILFVDLKLAPGESKSYSYRFTLPRGLPPSHKGRSIKVSYQLVIGTQRAGKGKEQQVKSVDVPFRVFGSVDHTGDILGHDLMSPYIVLRDQARTSVIDPITASKPDVKPKKPPDADGEADFKTYISALLDRSSPNGQPALLSPTSPLASPNGFPSPSLRRKSSVGEHPTSQLELIDLAILRSNHNPSTTSGLRNKFDIARSGRHVAALYLTRPSYRLGETIHLVASFAGAAIPTYALQVALETRETVDPAIAMRSGASIYRYARKVHAYDASSALFATRLSFALGIPWGGTPEFVTSGVGLEWRVRVEFVTPRVSAGGGGVGEELLEEVEEDERGVVLQGVEGLRVETFGVEVPIKVFAGGGGRKGEWDVEGLPV